MPFGFNSYSKPTPNRINILFDTLSALLSILASFFTTAAFVSHKFSDIAVGIITGLLIPLCPVIKRLFSVEPEVGQKTVPIEDVKVMEEKS